MAEGGFRIRSWIFYLSLLVFVAAVVLAIALPVTFAKQDEGQNIVKDVYTVEYVKKTGYRAELPEYFPIEENEDPFEVWNTSQKARDAYAKLDWVGKIGQISLFMYGDASGPGGSDGSEWAPLIRLNGIGGLNNLENFAARKKFAGYVPEGGIPILFGFDTIHGYKTIFPSNLGMSSAWSPELIKEYVAIAAEETKADGVPWTIGPMVDLGRDPRWGRVMEAAGEDPYLTGVLSRAYVEEFQKHGVATTVKHFAGYGFPEGGVDYTGAQIDEAQMWNDYMRTYDMAIQNEDYDMPADQRAWTVMGSFNLWDGIPSHASRKLNTDVLRGMWGWGGFMIGDYAAVGEFVNHGVSPDCPTSGRMSLYSGMDMNMHDGCHMEAFMTVTPYGDDQIAEAESEGRELVANVTLNMAAINSRAPDGRTYGDYIELSAKRVVAIKDKLGLFDKPLPDEEGEYLKDEWLDKAQEAAEKTMILLQNKDGTLPIKKDPTNNIVLVGKIASNSLIVSRVDQMGFWFGRGTDEDAVRKVVTYQAGLEAYLEANNAGKAANTDIAGATPEDPPVQTYKQGCSLLVNPPPEAAAENGIHAAEIAADKQHHEEFKAFLKAMLDSDDNKPTHVIAVVGENVTSNGESASRAHLNIPGSQLKLLEEIQQLREEYKADFKIIEVINAARPQVLSRFEQTNMDAIVMAWTPGSRGGAALPRLLFGDVDFSARATMSWPRNEGQIPIYYSQENPPRGPDYSAGVFWSGVKIYDSRYIDEWISPLYPFGYGLQYVPYTFSDASISSAKAPVDSTGNLTAKVTVNRAAGGKAGAEIVQVYMHQLVRQPAPNRKKLIGFKRVDFAEGDTKKEVTIDIPIQRQFSYWNNTLKRVVTAGDFRIFIAKDSTDESNAFDFTLTA